jgi:hypothetical protein
MTTYELANIARSVRVTEIALIARALRAEAVGYISHRESIDRARSIVAAREVEVR